jgi:hypothetical protein
MKTSVTFYPAHEFAEIFPFRDGPSLTALRDNIREHGQFDDIVLLDEKVLEGRRRQAAMIGAHLTPRYREFGSRESDGDDPLEFAYAANFHRRDDITKAEKEEAAVKYANLKRGFNAKGKTPNSSNEPLGKKPASQKETAEKFDMPVSRLKRAKVVLEKGVPELIEAYKSDEVSVSDAAAVAVEPPEVQRAAVEAVRAGEATTLQAAVAVIVPKAPAAADKEEVSRTLAAAAKELATIETTNTALRTQLVSNLDKIAAAVLRL